MRHGLTAAKTVLAGEDAKAFERLRRELIGRLTPKGPVEGELVDRLAALLWRLRRAPAAEAALLAALDAEGTSDPRPSLAAADLHDRHGILVARLQRYETHLERFFMRTLALLNKLREGSASPFPHSPAIDPADARAELARRIALMPERGKAMEHCGPRNED